MPPTRKHLLIAVHALQRMLAGTHHQVLDADQNIAARRVHADLDILATLLENPSGTAPQTRSGGP